MRDRQRPGQGFPKPGTVEVAYKDDVAIVRLLGEHDLATRSEVEGRIRALIGERAGLVIDVRDTEFLDASILNVLISADHQLADKHRSQLILLANTECRVQRVLELSGLLTVVPTAETPSQAVRIARDRID
jgi:anti-anti-sigma factor